MMSAFSNGVMRSPAEAPAWRSGFLGQLSAFERVGRGAILVDDQARVLEHNACVRFGDGLQLSGGFLQAPHSVDRHRLQRFLSVVLGTPGRSPAATVTLTLPRPSGLRPWLLDGIDCSDTMRGANGRAAALLLITDVERPARLTTELLAQVFELTVTEANLARELASGKSLQEASAQLAISEGHARQRLKAIFDKTNTARQGELIALLAKLG
jgi:DNA-binding CsgD family transcriptional regulator